MACLRESIVVRLAEGTLDRETLQHAEAHLVRCNECRQLVAELVRTERSSNDADNDPELGFAAGQMIAGRYRVLRRVGTGGMGEVYAVEDTALGEAVALKTLKPGEESDEWRVARLKSEIHLARQVTHRNVCRTYDLGVHQSAAAATTFLTMELLEGETLSARLRRDRRLSLESALPIVEQMIAGLAAAHQAGVVHGDFKSANVMLLRSRVAITDFGLARRAVERVDASDAVLGGSPAYMAPEQVEGRPASAASDIYALGVVAFEMITGRLPFHAATATGMALARLQAAAPLPTMVAPEIDARWDAVIARCLARAPTERFASVDEVGAALREAIAPARRRRGGRAALVAALAGCALLAALVATDAPSLSAAFGASDGPRPRPLGTVRPSLAVLPLDNRTDRAELAWLSTALPEMLRAELASGGQLRIIDGATVAQARLELGLRDDQLPTDDEVAWLHQRLAADYLIVGSLDAPVAGQIPLALRLQQQGVRAPHSRLVDRGGEDELFGSAARLSERLRVAVGAEPGPRASARGGPRALPGDIAAARLYAEGLARHRRFEPHKARELLERALAIEPDYAPAHVALSVVWETLGYRARARAAAKRAFELASALPLEQRLDTEARYRETTLEWAKAITLYELLCDQAPDDVALGVRLANAQRVANQPAASLATIARLRGLPPPLRDDPSIDIAEARTAYHAHDDARAATVAAAAVRKAQQAGATLVLAEAHRIEAMALDRTGDRTRALAAAEASRTAAAAAGARGIEANALYAIGLVHHHLGDLPRAELAWKQMLALAQAVENVSSASAALGNLAVIAGQRGDLAEAARQFLAAADVAGEAGEVTGQVQALCNASTARILQGELEQADRHLFAAMEVARRNGDRRGEASVNVLKAALALERGLAQEGIARAEDAVALLRAVRDPGREADALMTLGRARAQTGDLAGARRALQSCLDLDVDVVGLSRRASCSFETGSLAAITGARGEAERAYRAAVALHGKQGSERNALVAQLALAALQLDGGDARQVVAACRSVAATARAKRLRYTVASAHALSARAYVALRRPRLAERALADAREAAGDHESVPLRLDREITAAAVASLQGGGARALPALDRAIEAARRAQHVELELRGELTRAELELRLGQRARAVRRLAAASRRATTLGFKALAEAAGRVGR